MALVTPPSTTSALYSWMSLRTFPMATVGIGSRVLETEFDGLSEDATLPVDFRHNELGGLPVGIARRRDGARDVRRDSHLDRRSRAGPFGTQQPSSGRTCYPASGGERRGASQQTPAGHAV